MINWASNDDSNDDSTLLPQKIPLPFLYPFLHLRFYPAVLTPQAAEGVKLQVRTHPPPHALLGLVSRIKVYKGGGGGRGHK